MTEELLYVLNSHHAIWEKVESDDKDYNTRNDVLYQLLLTQGSATKKENFKGAEERAKELGWKKWVVTQFEIPFI